ncbi:MAG TPA: ribulose-phosphate 3-epimerase, partial [Desulfobacteraceae bacterium]|nr:ribulose-phosphate 3-epimerase [Desulfobacteraceae bacterium]
MKAISASILSADFRRLEDEIIKVQEAGVDYIHIDVMDGVFVPNITIGPMIVKAVKKVAEIPLDVHLMIVNPDRFIDTFVDSGSDILTVHAEASVHLHRTITYIKGKGIKAGVSLNPTTSLDLLEYILDELFMVVVMTVNPGFEAQPFIPSMLRKIERLRKMIDSRGLDTK